MDNIKNDFYYVSKMLKDIEFIINNTKDLTLELLRENEILTDSMMFRLIQISENSNKITESFKMRYKEIPWKAIKGLRNRIVHEYGDVDLTIVFDTIKNDIPILLQELDGLQ